jgi:hypothetical protein
VPHTRALAFKRPMIDFLWRFRPVAQVAQPVAAAKEVQVPVRKLKRFECSKPEVSRWVLSSGYLE